MHVTSGNDRTNALRDTSRVMFVVDICTRAKSVRIANSTAARTEEALNRALVPPIANAGRQINTRNPY